MAEVAGVWSHVAAQQPEVRATAMDDSNSNNNSATITSTDFLTLLVTEMQNQDPTATTDPNEYINQLVNVNSLEQLISINQTLTNAIGTTDSSSSAQTANTTVKAPIHNSDLLSIQQGQPFQAKVQGNLSVPAASAAADRVANALSSTH